MKVVVTGAGGLLGRALANELDDAHLLSHADLDITCREAVMAFDWSAVDVIVNTAAWTAVDEAEDVDSVPAVWDVNATGVANLAACARKHDLLLVHISTDYVFSSQEGLIAIDERLDPRCVYGITKAAGELAARLAPRHYVVRTSWVFGDSSDFIEAVLTKARRRQRLFVVGDQVGRPTLVGDLASAVLALLRRRAPSGTYHVTGSGDIVSWAQFASTVLETAGLECAIETVSTARFRELTEAVAIRPANSALDLTSVDSLGVNMPDWRLSLDRHMAERANERRPPPT